MFGGGAAVVIVYGMDTMGGGGFNSGLQLANDTSGMVVSRSAGTDFGGGAVVSNEDTDDGDTGVD